MLQQWLDSMLEWLKSLFYKQEMELTLVGLQNSGKTTLVNVVAVRAPPCPHATSRPAAVADRRSRVAVHRRAAFRRT